MDRSLTEMAIRGLEVERQRIDDAIRQLRSQIEDGSSGEQKKPEQKSEPQFQTERGTAPTEKKRSSISAAGRRRISEANKRRARANKESAAIAKPAVPAPAKDTTVKRGVLTPEGRARLAEAVRKRNIARGAASKKA